MASSNTGGWVRKVGASGGGRTYRRRRPVNYYAILGLIIVFGLVSVGFARYDYRNPPKGPTSSFAALSIFACGSDLPSLAPSLGSYRTLGSGVLLSTSTGTPTLNQFVNAYPGLTLTSTKLVIPPQGGKHAHSMTFANGTACPKGTKDAGKVGHVEIAYWPTLGTATPTLTTDSSTVPLSTRVQITVGFVPAGVTPPRPPASVLSAMTNAIQGIAPTSTTTTLPSSTTTTHAKH